MSTNSYRALEAFARLRGWDAVDAVTSSIAYWLDVATCADWSACIVNDGALEIRASACGSDQRFQVPVEVAFGDVMKTVRAHIKERERERQQHDYDHASSSGRAGKSCRMRVVVT